jgi:hypothetical protein
MKPTKYLLWTNVNGMLNDINVAANLNLNALILIVSDEVKSLMPDLTIQLD